MARSTWRYVGPDEAFTELGPLRVRVIGTAWHIEVLDANQDLVILVREELGPKYKKQPFAHRLAAAGYGAEKWLLARVKQLPSVWG